MIDQIKNNCLNANTGIYVFDVKKFESNFTNLINSYKKYYENTFISYSYKTNYTPYLCSTINSLGGWAEIVSEMELELTRKIGIKSNRVIFNGPYKSEKAISYCIDNKIIMNVDSIEELKKIHSLANTNEVKINIRFSSKLNQNKISRFGFDIDSSDWYEATKIFQENNNMIFNGVHCHFPYRDIESFYERTSFIKKIILAVKDICLLRYVSIGGGFYSNLPESILKKANIKQVSFKDYAKATAKPLSKFFKANHISPDLFIEPGTALVADTFSYYCRVISIKEIDTIQVATVNGSLLDISASAKFKNLPAELVFSNCDSREETNSTIIAGYTCIESDILSESFKYKLSVGDIIKYDNVGSYSIVMKPPFILPASEVFALRSNRLELIKNREDADYIFQNFIIKQDD